MRSVGTPAVRFRWVGDHDGARNNNFTIIRLIFASSVLFGHSWAITGTKGSDPISSLLTGYTWIGALAVNGFFAISGFLVAGSLVRHGVVGYSIARALRIFPGLAVCIALSVFVLGLFYTTLPAWDYLLAPQTQRYLLNATLVPRLEWSLPGVFTDHPYKALNGSLWTLKAEVACYIALGMVGLAGLLRQRLTATLACAAALAIGYLAFKSIPIFGSHPNWARPAAFFLLGVLVWAHRQSIPLHSGIALVALLAIAAMIGMQIPGSIFQPISAICFTYLIFFMAFAVPHINADRFPGDISYGVYIYSFPCQQLVYWNGQGPYTNAALAALLTGSLAALSWYLIEKTALEFKKPVTAWIRGTWQPGSLTRILRPMLGSEKRWIQRR